MEISYLMIFLMGLIVGSFLTSYTYRHRVKDSVLRGRSYCPKCKKGISWYDNVPLFSFLFLGGKCRNCKKKISVRYPLIEFITGVSYIAIWNSYLGCRISLNIFAPFCQLNGGYNLLVLLLLIIIVTLLIAVTIIDFETQEIPDNLSLLVFMLAFITLIVSNQADFYRRFAVTFVPSLFLFSIAVFTKGKGMGLGDVKLVLFGGLLLGSFMSLMWMVVSFALGAFIGLILIISGHAKFGREIPFAPFLVSGFVITLLWGDKLMSFI